MTTYIAKETQTNVEKQGKEPNKEPNKEPVEEPACGICYIALNNKNTVITTCNHAYCTTCFFKWLNRKETCAICRKVLLSDIVVEERLTALQDVQSELMDNYRCLRVLKRNIKKKRCKKNNLSDDINSLLNRQIRLRYLLQQTRSVCRETLTRSRFLKQAMEMQKESLDLMKNYRSEWEDLYAPLLAPAEEEESEDERNKMEEVDVVNMTAALDNMIRLESRRARTALRRMRETERAAAETIDAGSSDENDNNEEEDAEEERIAMGFSDATEDATEYETEDATEDANEDIEVDLTVFGTGIPTFDFTPLQTVVTARNHRQSPMFVFGATASESDFETSPPIIEMAGTTVELQESGFESTPINLEASRTSTEETITDE